MQQRYYDPLCGCFLSVDPATAYSPGGIFNQYWYANANPYGLVDPDGREAQTAQDCGDKPCPDPPPPPPVDLPPVTVSGTALPLPPTTTFPAVEVIGTNPPPTPWGLLVLEWTTSAGARLAGGVGLAMWPTPMGAAACEMPGGPRCGIMMSGAFPPGFWPGDTGAAEWGRRNGVGAREGKEKFHRGVKEHTPGKRGDHDFGVNPATGEVVDQNGDSVGNLNDE